MVRAVEVAGPLLGAVPVVEQGPVLVEGHVQLVLVPDPVDFGDVVREEVLEPLPCQLDLAVAGEVLSNAGGVQPPPENVRCVGVAGARDLGPPEAHDLERREPRVGDLPAGVFGGLVADQSALLGLESADAVNRVKLGLLPLFSVSHGLEEKVVHGATVL